MKRGRGGWIARRKRIEVEGGRGRLWVTMLGRWGGTDGVGVGVGLEMGMGMEMVLVLVMQGVDWG